VAVPPLALVVDDHPPSVELARYLLELDGFEVVCAGAGDEALSLASKRRPDVIVLDLDMPVVDGFEVHHHMAADPALSGVPVVVVTVLTIDEACTGHEPVDFAAYILKPVDPATFAAQVRAAIAHTDP
jgi:CheY-like chemotaxis protein